jgi:DNA-binding CsgD family transcriptional regulator/PAS domain-containing protein
MNLAVDRHIQTKVFVYRSASTGAFGRRDEAAFARVSRHLHNAVQVARRLALEEARSRDLLDVVEHLNFGVVLLTERGRVTHANRFARQLFTLRDGLVADDGVLAPIHRDDAPALMQTIRAALDAAHERAEEPTTAFIRRSGFVRPLSVLAVPLARTSEAPFPTIRRAAVALIVTDPDLDAAVPADALRARYHFSATEARLAQVLSRGVPLREAADTAGVTYETARWYLKGMFQKTGTARQADLVRLLLADHWLVS